MAKLVTPDMTVQEDATLKNPSPPSLCFYVWLPTHNRLVFKKAAKEDTEYNQLQVFSVEVTLDFERNSKKFLGSPLVWRFAGAL